MTKYKLQNIATGEIFEDSGWLLSDPNYNKPSLIRTVYSNKQLNLKGDSDGLYKFSDWLPISRKLANSSFPVTYKSEKLAKALDLENLYITFSGYWPEIGADMATCSFKETEAYSVCARLKPEQKGVIVVASAGNTSRAFAKVCSENSIPLLIVVPEDNLDALWFDAPINNCPVCSNNYRTYSRLLLSGYRKRNRYNSRLGGKSQAHRGWKVWRP